MGARLHATHRSETGAPAAETNALICDGKKSNRQQPCNNKKFIHEVIFRIGSLDVRSAKRIVAFFALYSICIVFVVDASLLPSRVLVCHFQLQLVIDCSERLKRRAHMILHQHEVASLSWLCSYRGGEAIPH